MAMLYAFYGDDFTGSTDVLEQLASNGVPAVLFLGLPTPNQLAAFPEMRAIGIAGDSRSRSPEWMREHLPPVFRTLRQFGAPVTHYKVCSTFDSSPAHGSIGCAIEIGREVFGPGFVPIVVGAPHLRRFVAFGNLFAAAPDGSIQRIDRHPMSRHPVTPMREADLRLHLRGQTDVPVGLIDLASLHNGRAAKDLEAQMGDGAEVVLFDTIDLASQSIIGNLIWERAQHAPLFSVSSSGLTTALVSAWRNAGAGFHESPEVQVNDSGPLLVVSGSCSVVTERQIRWALAHGYAGVPMHPGSLSNPDDLVASVTEHLRAGRDTVIYTSLGPTEEKAHGAALGRALGDSIRVWIERAGVKRVLLCGGDTSSHAVQQLGLYALTWKANLQPGAPLCRAHANGPLDGLELVLKGGQVGTEDFFSVVRGAG